MRIVIGSYESQSILERWWFHGWRILHESETIIYQPDDIISDVSAAERRRLAPQTCRGCSGGVSREIAFWERRRWHVSQVAYDVTYREMVPETGVCELIFACGDRDIVQLGARHKHAQDGSMRSRAGQLNVVW